MYKHPRVYNLKVVVLSSPLAYDTAACEYRYFYQALPTSCSGRISTSTELIPGMIDL
jgi:hypothetical protein